jgi:hypothetical protein
MKNGELLRLLAAHRDSNDRLMARARTLSPEEVEASTDPEVLSIRRMAFAVRGEIHRMRGFVRLAPLGDRILWGRISPHHDVGFEVADFLARRFPGTIIVLGDGRRSWSSLYAKGAILHEEGGGLCATLAEISGIMGLKFEGGEKDEKGDMGESKAEMGQNNEEDGKKHEQAADLWSVYYRSQDVPRKAGGRRYGGRISRRALRSASLDAEKEGGSMKLQDFI